MTFFLHNSEIYGYMVDPSFMTLNAQNVITFNGITDPAVPTEAAARVAGDATNANAITAEASTRAAAVTTEANTRAAADTANANAISAETTRATTAEALLAPKTSVGPFGAANFVPTDNFGGTISSSRYTAVLGSSGAPDTTANPVAVFQRWGGYATQGVNAALYSSAFKTLNGPNLSVQGAYFEAEDLAGWNGVGVNNFIEGARAQATLGTSTHLGSAYGFVSTAGEGPGATHTYIVGNESAVYNNSADDAAIFNKASFCTAFIATSLGSHKTFAAFTVNPYTPVAGSFLNGYYVPLGDANTPVVNSAFKSDAASVWGLDLTGAATTFGAIGINNNTAIRSMNGAHSTTLAMLQLGNTDVAFVAADPAIALVSLGGASVPVQANGPFKAVQHVSLTAIAAPATPAAGQFYVYMDTADNKLKCKGPSGTVTVLGLP